MRFFVKITFLFVCILFSASSHAQTFGENKSTNENNVAKQAIISDDNILSQLKEEREEVKQNQQNIFRPKGGLDLLNQPTEDGSERGDLNIVEVDEKGNSRRAEKIFLYFDEFKMSNRYSVTPSCDVRFIVLPTLDRQLFALNVKLVWPQMTTSLAFNKVPPNTPTYLQYTLMGEGCYNMDKMPNIIVNRCRIKGISASECADKIVWLNGVIKK